MSAPPRITQRQISCGHQMGRSRVQDCSARDSFEAWTPPCLKMGYPLFRMSISCTRDSFDVLNGILEAFYEGKLWTREPLRANLAAALPDVEREGEHSSR
ncbi:hypothetical protein BN1723_004835 [Verticillium longisporum]|uniref:Uncharacterized protein n=1 Tax=Verticillium longisporum TaxID=100787 RepID=A0A0G4N295_VERLO|nr:hypothetical protein BN1723_004835 [Verticillium longisporum]